MQERLATDQALAANVRVNTLENARPTLNHVLNDRIQDMVDVSFKFYKLLTEAPAFANFFQELMFNRYLRVAKFGNGAHYRPGSRGIPGR